MGALIAYLSRGVIEVARVLSQTSTEHTEPNPHNGDQGPGSLGRYTGCCCVLLLHPWHRDMGELTL